MTTQSAPQQGQSSQQNQAWTRKIKGLVPAFDPKAVDQPFVVDGRNFVMDAEGPYAGFAHIYSSYDKIYNPTMMDTVQCGNEILYCTNNAILKYDPIGMWFIPVYTFTAVTDAWPWSVAYIGSKYYLCREGVGVIQYDPAKQSFQNINTMTFQDSTGTTQNVSTFLPVNPCGICQSYGRLIILGSDKIVWSAQDNGIYLIPDLTAGSAYQGLSIIGGSPINIKEVIDGFVTFTSNGLLKSELNNGQTVYNHYTLSRTAKLLNPFCVVTMPNAIGTTTSPFLSASDMILTFLTKQGFYTTDGHVPRAWEPVFTEFVTRKLLPKYKDLSVTSLIRMYYVEDRKWLIISVSSDSPQLYEQAYVLYTPTDDWGIFNELHCAFGLFSLQNNLESNYNLGYVDWNGYVHSFQDATFKELTFNAVDNYLYRQKTESISHYIEGGVLIASTQMRMGSVNEFIYSSVASGLYGQSEFFYLEIDPSLIQPVGGISIVAINGVSGEDWLTYPGTGADVFEDYLTSLNPNEDWNNNTVFPSYYMPQFSGWATGFGKIAIISVGRNYAGLDSYVKVGLFRLSDGQYADELSQITNIAVGMFYETGLALMEDWLNWVPSFPDVSVDWLPIPTGTQDEDWGGSGTSNTVEYNISVIATNDGENIFNIATPVLAYDENGVEYYTLDLSGIFHIVEISATDVNQSFHLRFLEVSGNVAGRL